MHDAKRSPIFSKVEKWIMKPKVANHMSRIESYKSLNKSIYTSILSSPSRMSYFSRVVVPRSLLLPMQVVKNDKNLIDDNKIKYIITPMINGKRHPYDPIMYYPKSNRLLQNLSEKIGEKKYGKAPKLLITAGTYSDTPFINETGWIKKTSTVVDSLLLNQITGSLKSKLKAYSHSVKSDKAVLSFKSCGKPYSFKDGQITLYITNIFKDHPEIVESLKSKLLTKDMALKINEESLPLLQSICQYEIFRNL